MEDEAALDENAGEDTIYFVSANLYRDGAPLRPGSDKYGYIFSFANNGDGSAVSADQELAAELFP